VVCRVSSWGHPCFLSIGRSSPHHGKHVGGDTDGPQDNAAVEIDIGIQIVLNEIIIFSSNHFKLFGGIQQRIGYFKFV
jgi:hypothetical protein